MRVYVRTSLGNFIETKQDISFLLFQALVGTNSSNNSTAPAAVITVTVTLDLLVHNVLYWLPPEGPLVCADDRLLTNPAASAFVIRFARDFGNLLSAVNVSD